MKKERNTKIVTFNQVLQKFPPHFGGEVKVNRFTRLLLVNGKPFIPLIYDVMFWGKKLAGYDTPENSLEIVTKESGFNALCLWGSHTKENIDDCAKMGMKVIPFPPVTWQKRGEELTKALQDVVKEYKDCPNLLAWFISDEGNIGGSETEFKRQHYSFQRRGCF